MKKQWNDDSLKRRYERLMEKARGEGFSPDELEPPLLDRFSNQTGSPRIIRMVQLAYTLGQLQSIEAIDKDGAPVTAAGSGQEPLTVEALRSINRDMHPRRWVWIENLKEPEHEVTPSAYYQVCSDYSGGKSFCCGYPGYGVHFNYDEYGKGWLAYRYKPSAPADDKGCAR